MSFRRAAEDVKHFQVRFSPDGKLVVTASADHTARVWDAVTGMQRTVLRGHDGPVLSAGFSPDGTHVLTASGDNTARVWDAASGIGRVVLKGILEVA